MQWYEVRDLLPHAEEEVLITYISKYNDKRCVTTAIFYPQYYDVDFQPYDDEWDADEIKETFKYLEDEDVWMFKKSMWLHPNYGTDNIGCYMDEEIVAWARLPQPYEE